MLRTEFIMLQQLWSPVACCFRLLQAVKNDGDGDRWAHSLQKRNLGQQKHRPNWPNFRL